MKIIGLTGPIASGKDEAAKILKALGADVIDADKLTHQLYATHTPLWGEMVKAFGSKILSRGGAINRKKLGDIVFGNKQKLEELNKLVHPVLKEEIRKIIEVVSCGSDIQPDRVVNCKLLVINAALLAEIGLVELVDEVWLVLSSKKIRLKRLLASGLSKKDALCRMRFQQGAKHYLAIADIVIKNDSTVKALRAKVKEVVHKSIQAGI